MDKDMKLIMEKWRGIQDRSKKLKLGVLSETLRIKENLGLDGRDYIPPSDIPEPLNGDELDDVIKGMLQAAYGPEDRRDPADKASDCLKHGTGDSPARYLLSNTVEADPNGGANSHGVPMEAVMAVLRKIKNLQSLKANRVDADAICGSLRRISPTAQEPLSLNEEEGNPFQSAIQKQIDVLQQVYTSIGNTSKSLPEPFKDSAENRTLNLAIDQVRGAMEHLKEVCPDCRTLPGTLR